MSRADYAGLSTFGIQRHAHRAHERAASENSTQIIVHRFHDLAWPFVLFVAVMKQKFGESRHQSSGSSMTSGIRDPE